MAIPARTLEHARSIHALIEEAARTQQEALHLERRASQSLLIARRVIRDVDAALARRALQLHLVTRRAGAGLIIASPRHVATAQGASDRARRHSW